MADPIIKSSKMGKRKLPEELKVFYIVCSSGKDVLALFHCFQDYYCYSNSDVMHHVTKYCNVIGPYCTVQWNTACILTQLTRPFPLFVEVGLACETSWKFIYL